MKWYPVVDAKLEGYTLPPCRSCGKWALKAKVQESPEVPTGFVAWVECGACGVSSREEEGRSCHARYDGKVANLGRRGGDAICP